MRCGSWRAVRGIRRLCGCLPNSWTWSGRSSSWVGPWVCAPATPGPPWPMFRSTGRRLTARSWNCCPRGRHISFRSQWLSSLTRRMPDRSCGRRSGITGA
ncbi:hypothetical protein ACWGII_39615 [Streptomyces sp. NPDC054855]